MLSCFKRIDFSQNKVGTISPFRYFFGFSWAVFFCLNFFYIFLEFRNYMVSWSSRATATFSITLYCIRRLLLTAHRAVSHCSASASTGFMLAKTKKIDMNYLRLDEILNQELDWKIFTFRHRPIEKSAHPRVGNKNSAYPQTHVSASSSQDAMKWLALKSHCYSVIEANEYLFQLKTYFFFFVSM